MARKSNLLIVPQYLRYHSVPAEPGPTKEARSDDNNKGKGGKKRRGQGRKQPRLPPAIAAAIQKVEEIGAPYDGPCLAFDTETTTCVGQRFRVGYYQLRGIPPEARIDLAKRGKLTREALDELREHGFVYESAAVTAVDIARLQQFASKVSRRMPRLPPLKVLTRSEFNKGPLVGTGDYWKQHYKPQRAWSKDQKYGICDNLVIGFNLPFDIAAVADEYWLARKDFYGGFGFKLCDCAVPGGKRCAYHPGIKINPIAPRKALYACAVEEIPPKHSRRKAESNTRKTRFLDAQTFARALLGPDGGGSLKALSRILKLPHTVREWTGDHGAPLTDRYLFYLMKDVWGTWDLYVYLRDIYRRHGISRPMWKIVSEASLGKGYYDDLGVPRFSRQHADFPPEVIGKFMSTFYAGRSEVRHRLRPCDVILCDFRSQYPTVNALMGLQDLLLAETIEVRVNSPEALDFLRNVTRADLQKKETWRRLWGIAKVRPDRDVLPVRAPFCAVKDSRNIGLCDVEDGPPTYYTFADLIVSKLNTGKYPEIVETIELVPHGRMKTRKIILFGDTRYEIDLAETDLFARLIGLRSDIERRKRSLPIGSPEYQQCDMLQKALKLLANATSYGALVEYVVDERDERRATNVYTADDSHRKMTKKIERPGAYFAGPIGVLIPGAGRLLLALAETLAAERGIKHVFCDTDSMCWARPDGMDHAEFEAKVQEIVDWFTPLSPYNDGASILKVEHRHVRCIAVSAKRYALYRLGDPAAGEPRIVFVKISSHGMGAITDPEGYQSIFPDAPDIETRRDLVEAKHAAAVIYDIWREAVEAIEDGRPIPKWRHYLEPYPYFAKAAIGNRHQLNLYEDLPNVRPFMFFTMVPHMLRIPLADRGTPEQEARWDALTQTAFYAPFSLSWDEIKRTLSRRDTGELVELTAEDLDHVRFQTLNDRLKHYFEHEEHKAWPPDGIGELARRKVRISHQEYLGKESRPGSEFEDYELEEELDGPGLVVDGHVDEASLRAALERVSLTKLAEISGVSRTALHRYRSGVRTPHGEQVIAIRSALAQLEQAETSTSGEPSRPGKRANDRNRGSNRQDGLRARALNLPAGNGTRSGLQRVIKAAEPYLTASRLRNFVRRGVMLPPEDEAMLKDVVTRLEAEE